MVPPTAQAAVQEGHVVARNIIAVIDGREEDLRRFEYRPLGQLVELGSDFAVNEVMGVRFTGLLAAIFWRMAYLVRLNSPQSKVHVAADWIVGLDRKSTRLNSSHANISYAVFCLKKKRPDE